MSLTTLLLAFAPAAFRAKVKPEVKSTELLLSERRVQDLESALRRADDRIRQLTQERDAWRAPVRAEPIRPMTQEEAARFSRLQHQMMLAQQQMPARYQQQQGLAEYQNYQNALAAPGLADLVEAIDCTGGGRARHLTGALNALNALNTLNTLGSLGGV